MKKPLLWKSLAVALLAGALLIALNMIRGVIIERQQLQQQVEANIAETAAGAQTITGPLLVVPYKERVTVEERDKEDRVRVVVREFERRAIFVPELLEIDGRVDVTPRKRGLYQALLYTVNGSLRARFQVPVHLGYEGDLKNITPGRAYVALGLSDVRGFQSLARMTWNGSTLTPEQGAHLEALGNGIHAAVGTLAQQEPATYQMEMQLDVLGMSSFSLAPIGKTTTMKLDSAWPHPSSIGRFLPRAKAQGDAYFPATWSISHLANNSAADLTSKEAAAKFHPPRDTFGVSFIEPVNVYLQSERALKYGVLFIGLTFAAFFLFELLQALRIHPLQYGFVGLALALFYLLLVSLSEHFSFLFAYAAASGACVALIGYYLAHVLRSRLRGAVFAGKLAVLYAALYGLLQSEDSALLLGSLLLFGILAVVMVLTRKIDWYALTERAAKGAA